MEDISGKKIPRDLDIDDAVVQCKYDGFKIIIDRKLNDIEIFTRRFVNVEDNIPDLDQIYKSIPYNTILIGEFIIYINGKQSLSAAHSALLSKRNKYPPKNYSIIIYDILRFKGEYLNNFPYSIRFKALDKINFPPQIKLIKNYPWKDRLKLLNKCTKEGCDGIVIKSNDGKFSFRRFGEPEPFGKQWKYKVSNYKSADVFLKDYNKGKAKYIFDTYQWRDGEEFYTGKLSGLDKSTESEIKNMIDKGYTPVVEVSYQERLPSGKFRHMGWIRYRPDKPLKSVTY